MRHELEQSLYKHLGFLQRSTEWYDAGHQSEAERIAVTLRVLFHSTAVSSPLVQQLGMGNMLLRSSLDDDTVEANGKSLIHLEVVEAPIRELQAAPLLAKANPSRVLALAKWWDEEQVFLSLFPNYSGTRKDLVLSLCNKDGAHVDSKLSEFDDALRTFYDLTISVERKLEGREPQKSRDYRIGNALHASVRQIAYEVLDAPAIIRFMARV
jgi:hypothetical protein